MTIPAGAYKLAPVPVPSALPVPDPANVVTTPLDMTILRILLLPESAAKMFIPSVVILLSFQNLAEVPVPSANPPDPPAKVETT